MGFKKSIFSGYVYQLETPLGPLGASIKEELFCTLGAALGAAAAAVPCQEFEESMLTFDV